MKCKQKKSSKQILSDKIADALTLKPRADIEDDQVFGTKPQTVTRLELGSSDSDEEATISEFRKRNVNLLSQVSKKYEGQIVSRTELDNSDVSNDSFKESASGSLGLNINKSFSSDSDNEPENVDIQTKLSQLYDSEDSDDSESKLDKNQVNKTNRNSSKSVSNDKSTDSEDDDKNSNEDDSDEEETDEDEGYDISKLDEPLSEDFEHVKKQNISEEAKKGLSVRNQLLLWEGLLEMRIHLQRCINTANQMPMPEQNKLLKENNQFVEETNSAKANISSVLDKMLNLQSLLFKNYPETKMLSSTKQLNKSNATLVKKDDSDEEIPSDTDNEEIPSDTEEDEPMEKPSSKVNVNNKTTTKKRRYEDYEKEISSCHKAFKSFRDTTIQKWNDKTRLATATNIKNTPTNTVLQQISYILSDKEKLIHRTQLKRSEYDIVGYKKDEPVDMEIKSTKDRKDVDEYIPEIFDDSDFYHQLLRELIECKSSDISDPVQLSRQWIALQQMRSKMKRKVDTKATKGRKIKYVVHNKLLNYMAPFKSTKWTDESANELYSSLFGKLFEHNNIGLNGDIGNIYKLI